MDARPHVEQSLDEWITASGNQLQNDEQKAAWKARADAYKNDFIRTVGSHADSQSKVWYTDVNKTTAKLAIDRIAANPLDFKNVASGYADLQNAYLKNAQLAGATPGDEIWNDAIRSAQKDGLVARIGAVGATNPSEALRIAEKSKDILGADYDNVYTTLRTRAISDEGASQAQAAYDKYAATGKPTVRVPGQGGLPDWGETYLSNIKAQESGGNVNAKSTTSSATGLYQFIDSTWRNLIRTHPELGLTPNGRTDPAQQEKAVRAFTADNATALGRHRVPITPGNLYMAAFFGAEGASHIYDLPGNTPMTQAVSEQVLSANGWLRGKTVDQIRQWAAGHAGKGIDPSMGGVGGQGAVAASQAPVPVDVGHPDTVGQAAPVVPPADATVAMPDTPAPSTAGTTPEGSASAKAQMVQDILDSDSEWPVKEHALTVLNQMLAAQQIAADTTAAAKKAAKEDKTNKYVTSMLSPNANFAQLQQQITQDTDLDGETKLSLTNALAAHADQSVQGSTMAYGPEMWAAYNKILLPIGDPNRISDVSQIMKMAAPGPNGETPALTLAGAQKLSTIMKDAQKTPKDEAVQKSKLSLEAYAKSKLSNQREPNMLLNDPGHADPIGEQAFNATFIPKFEAAFDDWVQAGKDPWEFLTQSNVDKMMHGIRDPQEVAMQNIMGGINPTPQVPAPAGVDQENWDFLVAKPPFALVAKDPNINWSGIMGALAANPTPANIQWFDYKYGAGNPGYSAKNILDALGVEPKTENTAPAAPAQPLVVDTNSMEYIRGTLPMPAGQ
jgi:hypothetical protein